MTRFSFVFVLAVFVGLASTVSASNITTIGTTDPTSPAVITDLVGALDSVIGYLGPAAMEGVGEGQHASEEVADLYKETQRLWEVLSEGSSLEGSRLSVYKSKTLQILDLLEQLFTHPVKLLQSSGLLKNRIRGKACISPFTQLRKLSAIAQNDSSAATTEYLKVYMDFLSCFSEEDILMGVNAITRSLMECQRVSRSSSGPGFTTVSEKQAHASCAVAIAREFEMLFDLTPSPSTKVGFSIDDLIKVGGRDGMLSSEDEIYYRSKLTLYDVDSDGFLTFDELDELGTALSAASADLAKDQGWSLGALVLWYAGLAIGTLLLLWSLITIIVWEILRKIWRWIRG